MSVKPPWPGPLHQQTQQPRGTRAPHAALHPSSPLFLCLPFSAPGEKGLSGSQVWHMPQNKWTPALRSPSSAVQLVLPGSCAKRLTPRVPEAPRFTPVRHWCSMTFHSTHSAGVNCTLPAACRAVGLERGGGRHSPFAQFPAAGALPPPPTWISTLGEGGEWEGKAEPSSLFSSKGMLRLGKARCKSECFALFYGCVFVLRVNFALAAARAQAEPGQGDLAETTGCA